MKGGYYLTEESAVVLVWRKGYDNRIALVAMLSEWRTPLAAEASGVPYLRETH